MEFGVNRQDMHRSENSFSLDLVAGGSGSDPPARPWLGVWFECAGAYQRVTRNAAGTQYVARCPKCGKSVTFRVGSGGTGERFFKVRC